MIEKLLDNKKLNFKDVITKYVKSLHSKYASSFYTGLISPIADACAAAFANQKHLDVDLYTKREASWVKSRINDEIEIKEAKEKFDIIDKEYKENLGQISQIARFERVQFEMDELDVDKQLDDFEKQIVEKEKELKELPENQKEKKTKIGK